MGLPVWCTDQAGPFPTVLMVLSSGNALPAATNVTFDPTPGTAIPTTVRTYPVPDEIIEVTPDVRGYEYVTLPDGRIALVHPQDRTIVTILD